MNKGKFIFSQVIDFLPRYELSRSIMEISDIGI